MKVGELIERLSKYDADADVCVDVTNCISAYGAEPVTNVSCGFDWTSGKVLLFTETKLHRYGKCCVKCGLTRSREGERIGTQFLRDFTDDSKPMTLCVTLDGKQKARFTFTPENRGLEK